MRFFDVEANNIEQAIAYWEACLADGSWSEDKAQALLMKQDDPDLLIKAMMRHGGSGAATKRP